MSTRARHPEPSSMPCTSVQALAREALLSSESGELPDPARMHAEGCPVCRAEIEGLSTLRDSLSMSLTAARVEIADPSPDRVDAVLAARSVQPPEAATLRSIRITVRRMLWLTLLLLALSPVAWLLIRLFLALKGH